MIELSLLIAQNNFISYYLMKNFRSSKNLKAIDLNNKDESSLRMKIRSLEEQVQLLQKSNLNIFIPLSEHESKPEPNYEMIINKLKTQILNLQQEVQRQKSSIKKLQNQKEMQRINFLNEISKLKEQISDLREEKAELEEEIGNLGEQVDREKGKRQQKQKQNIQLRVENKFLHDDIEQLKKRSQAIEKKYEELQSCVLAVNFHSRIYKSRETKVTAIETAELRSLKDYIEELQRKVKELLLSNKQQRVTLGVPRDNLGEEIVRLKRNIDMQLGLNFSEESTSSFLSVYNQTNLRFDELINGCRQ